MEIESWNNLLGAVWRLEPQRHPAEIAQWEAAVDAHACWFDWHETPETLVKEEHTSDILGAGSG